MAPVDSAQTAGKNGAELQGPPTPEANSDRNDFIVAAPSVSLRKGGGAIRGIGEKFGVNPSTGTASISVPIFASPGRSRFGPALSLSYDSGNGNGPFGLGWSLSAPAILRRTDRGLPRFQDARSLQETDSDIFLLSGIEDLVRVLERQGKDWIPTSRKATLAGKNYRVFSYRPRIEGPFAQIERWLSDTDPADHFWRSITRENVTSWYGRTDASRISDPDDPSKIFGWLISEDYA